MRARTRTSPRRVWVRGDGRRRRRRACRGVRRLGEPPPARRRRAGSPRRGRARRRASFRRPNARKVSRGWWGDALVRVRGSRLRWWAAKGGERSRGVETSRREIASRGRRVRGWHSCVLARGFEISSVGLRGGVGAYLRASPWRRPSGVVRQGIVEDGIGTIPGGICVEEDRGRRRQRAVAGGDSRVFFSGEPSSVGSRDWGMAGAGGNL